MNRLRDFFEQANNEQQDHLKLTKKTSPFIALGLGISVTILIGGVIGTITTAPTTNPTAFWAIVIGSGLVSGIATYIFMNWITSWFLAKNTELTKVAQELEFFRRAGDKLGAFMFFVEGSNLDKTLDWFHGTNSRSLNMVIAQVIQEQLDRSFGPTFISIPISTYADHSNVLMRLLLGAENVCLTCIKSPKNWLLELDSDRVEHESLPPSLQSEFDIDPISLPNYSQERVKKYPTHFIRFLHLTNPGVRRRRAFLLDENEWNDLINRENIAFFHKFMDPCKHSVETRFVNTKRLQHIVSLRPEAKIQAQVTRAIEEDVLQKDYDIFEEKAMLVYRPGIPGTAGDDSEETELLEFQVGDRVTIYANFLNLVFEVFKKDYGVYTVEEIEELIALPPNGGEGNGFTKDLVSDTDKQDEVNEGKRTLPTASSDKKGSSSDVDPKLNEES